MSQNPEVIEPNFEGEKMKIPSAYVPIETPKINKSQSIMNWPIIFLLGILLIAILGGLYYWYYTIMSTPLNDFSSTLRPTIEENNEPESTTAEARTEALGTVSTSDELDAISADLDSTNIDNLDTELSTVDSELENSLNSQ